MVVLANMGIGTAPRSPGQGWDGHGVFQWKRSVSETKKMFTVAAPGRSLVPSPQPGRQSREVLARPTQPSCGHTASPAGLGPPWPLARQRCCSGVFPGCCLSLCTGTGEPSESSPRSERVCGFGPQKVWPPAESVLSPYTLKRRARWVVKYYK